MSSMAEISSGVFRQNSKKEKRKEVAKRINIPYKNTKNVISLGKRQTQADVQKTTDPSQASV